MKGIALSLNMKKALALVLAVVLLPALATEVYVYYTWYRTRLETQEIENLEIAKSVALSVSEAFRGLRLQEDIIGAAILQGHSEAELRGLLAVAADQAEAIHSVHWVTADGRIALSSAPEAEGTSVADREYFKASITGTGFVVSNLLADERVTKGYAFVIAQSIWSEGQLKGVVTAVINPVRLGDILSFERAGKGAVSVYDAQGVMIFSEPDMPQDYESRREADPLLAKALSGQAVSGSLVMPDGQRGIGARVPVRGSGWVAGASRPNSEIMQPLMQPLVLLIALIVGVVVVSALAATAVGNTILKDVRLLEQHAMEMGRGNLDHRVQIKGIAEMKRLAEAYTDMAGKRKQVEDVLKETAENLARSNRDLEQFAYVASHDLQEPLRMVGGYLQLIDRRYKEKLDQDGREFISFAVDGANRMQQLINDLLAYSRVGTRGKEFGPVDTNEALRCAEANLEMLLAETQAEIVRESLPTVTGDFSQLVQLFQNLLSNAVKFRREGVPPKIHVGAQSMDDTWQFSVSDNGIGIEPQYFERIFVIFQRLHNRQKYTGTGIGLAICKKIVDRHGGRIWVESEPGNGSTFYFTLAGAR